MFSTSANTFAPQINKVMYGPEVFTSTATCCQAQQSRARLGNRDVGIGSVTYVECMT